LAEFEVLKYLPSFPYWRSHCFHFVFIGACLMCSPWRLRFIMALSLLVSALIWQTSTVRRLMAHET